jgi:hypothetical protein
VEAVEEEPQMVLLEQAVMVEAPVVVKGLLVTAQRVQLIRVAAAEAH